MIEGFEEAVHQNNKHGKSNSTRKDYRRRIRRICEYLREKQPQYHSIGVKQLTEEEKNDVTKYYFPPKNPEDLKYTGLNVKFIMKFLMDTKNKDNNGKIKQYDDQRKYKDAIVWGSKVVNQPLPVDFYRAIEQYLASYKKVAVNARKEGKTDENSSDPITTALYKLILGWGIEANNIFLWVWTLFQWNCMARCMSIDGLCFHNFTLGQDSIVCKYDDSKADKDGEKLSEKNIFANPTDWKQCPWTALGIYCSIESDKLILEEKLFLRGGVDPGTAGAKYQEQLGNLLKAHEDIVSQHIRFKHAGAYGIRKGSATHATSGTTCPPPIPSIARRGEWSMGKVLDVYWHFSEPGDLFLGRILVGLDPLTALFSILAPHWITPDPLNDPDIKKAAEMTFGALLTIYKGKDHDPCALLLRCLACIVYSSEGLIAVMVRIPGHDFNKLSILHDRVLLSRLRLKVTVEKTPGVMEAPTGIPPHIELSIQAKVTGFLLLLLLLFYLVTNILFILLRLAEYL